MIRILGPQIGKINILYIKEKYQFLNCNQEMQFLRHFSLNELHYSEHWNRGSNSMFKIYVHAVCMCMKYVRWDKEQRNRWQMTWESFSGECRKHLAIRIVHIGLDGKWVWFCRLDLGTIFLFSKDIQATQTEIWANKFTDSLKSCHAISSTTSWKEDLLYGEVYIGKF